MQQKLQSSGAELEGKAGSDEHLGRGGGGDAHTLHAEIHVSSKESKRAVCSHSHQGLVKGPMYWPLLSYILMY